MGDVNIKPGGGGGADLDVITARDGDVLPGKTFVGKEGELIAGTMPVQGGSTTAPGTSNKTLVSAGRYVNGNVVVAGDGNLVARNIKKGVPMFRLVGEWEGYVSPVIFRG